MELDDNVCLCFRVTRRKLENYVRLTKPKVASQLSLCNGAGTGCGWCVPFLKQIFQRTSTGTGTDLDQMSSAEYAEKRAAYRLKKDQPPPPESPTSDN